MVQDNNMIQNQSQKKKNVFDGEFQLKKFPNSEIDYLNIMIAIENTCGLKPETPVNMVINTSVGYCVWKPTATWPMSVER